MALSFRAAQLALIVIASATASDVSAQVVRDTSAFVDPRQLSFPLLVEDDLPRELHLTTRDSLTLKFTVLNRGSSPIFLKYGSCSLKVSARRVGSTDSLQARIQRGERIWDPPGAWGEVSYLESPSPATVCTLELRTKTLLPGESMTLPWRASPLPAGQYRLGACLNLDEYPRPGEGGLQTVRWCPARGSNVFVTTSK